MNRQKLAFGKVNYILLAIGLAVVVLGFFLMSGGNSTEKHFDPSVFSAMRIKVAPVVTFFGFISIIGAIIYKPKDASNDSAELTSKTVNKDLTDK